MIGMQELVGHWRLVSFIEQHAGGPWSDALGPDAKGCISYWPTGHVQVLIGALDRPVVVAYLCVVVVMFVAINLLVDIACGLIDPRIRQGGAGGGSGA